jgi:hypothetical protein
MLTTRAHAQTVRAPLVAAFLAALTLAACGTAAAPSPSPGPSTAAATTRPTPTHVPGDGGTGGGIGVDPGSGSGGSGGGAGGGSDPGTGGGGGIFPLPPDPNQNPLLGDANYVVAGKDLINQHAVNVQLVRAIVRDDGKAVADLRWWSGVAPCNQLDHVEIVKDDAAKTIHLTVVEGSGQGDVACIEIAELHATVVDLGALGAGKWTISVEGDAPAISLDVP